MEGAGALPRRLAVVTGKGKVGKEAGGSVVREAVAALLRARRSPFQVLHACLLRAKPEVDARCAHKAVAALLRARCSPFQVLRAGLSCACKIQRALALASAQIFACVHARLLTCRYVQRPTE